MQDEIKVDTSVRTFVEKRNSLASVIFETSNFNVVKKVVIVHHGKYS